MAFKASPDKEYKPSKNRKKVIATPNDARDKPKKKKVYPFRRCEEQAERIRNMAAVGVSVTSMAMIENINESTLRDNYPEEIRAELQKTLHKLRHVQFEVALDDRHPRMLEWLGKQYLGQADKQEFNGSITHTVDNILQDLDGRTRGLPKEPGDSQ